MTIRSLALPTAFALAWIASPLESQTQTSPATRPEFEVASIKLNTAGGFTNMRPPAGGRFTVTNASLKMLLGLAYKVRNFEMSGGPGWIDSDRYDLMARAADNALGLDGLRPMLQSLLEDRFKLMVHWETKEMPVYTLFAAKNGPKLPAANDAACVAFGPNTAPPPPPAPGQRPPTPCGGLLMDPNHIEGGKISVTQLVNGLTNILGRTVIDKTEYIGTFDVHLEFTPEGTAFRSVGPSGGDNVPTPGDTSAPSIFTALQEQLGLRLESQKSPVKILVIDHADKPSEN